MKIVIAGGGRVGGLLASRLVAEGHSVTVIDRDREVCERIFEDVGAVTITGDAADARVLERASIGSADVAAGVLARDADNLAFATLSRSMGGARVMVRMLDQSYRDAYRLAGVRDVVAEADLVVGKMATAIEFPEVVGSLPLVQGDAILFELTVPAGAHAAGRTVAEVRGDPAFPPDCVFIGSLDRDGRIELPSGSTQLVPGRTLILVARREQLARAVAFLTSEPEVALPPLPVADTLRRIDFLAPLGEEELAELARGIELTRRAAGDTVFRHGEPGDEFFIVLTGEVGLAGEGGREVQVIGPGGFFGEIALLTGEPRSATARAVKDTELVSIGREVFRKIVMANPAVALEMSRILGQRLARATSQLSPRRGLFRR